jgi:hypothetical protein
MLLLNISRPPCLYFFPPRKNGLIKSCSPSEDLSKNTKFHSPALSGASFEFASEVSFAILEWLQLQH